MNHPADKKRDKAFQLMLVFVLLCLPVNGSIAQTFYVSPGGNDNNPGSEEQPFLTIERAKSAIRSMNEHMVDDITVYLRGGTYALTDTLTFDQYDSGSNGFHVVYKAYPGELPIISGGRHITGWEPIGNGVYKARVGTLRFRQLYVNGKRAVRARTPNEGSFFRLVRWDEDSRTIVLNSNEVSNWDDVNEVELVIHKQWIQNNFRISSILTDGSVAIVTPLEPERTKGFIPSSRHLRFPLAAYVLENAYEFIDAEGEWYLRTSTGELFYKPRNSEDMSTGVVIAIAPTLQEILRVQGTLDSPVRSLEFHGILFEHSTWIEPSEIGLEVGQADVIHGNPIPGRMIPSAVFIQYTEGLRLERNVFRNLGGSGLTLYSGTRDSVIIGNIFEEIAASGITVDHHLHENPSNAREVCRNDVITNNMITRIGRDYHSGVGIFAGYTDGTIIEHNELTDLPYDGIHVGWGWTTKDTALKNARVQYNRLHNVMNQLADGGAIYTLSKQPGTRIAENYIYDVVRSPWAGDYNVSGLYLDEGSSEITVENNVMENVERGIFFHNTGDNTVINHTNTYEEYESAGLNTFVDTGTIDAVAIKSNAGIEKHYADILRDHKE